MLKVFIPLLPPGINQTYKISNVSGKSHMYKSVGAMSWVLSASLIIGSEAADQKWVDNLEWYALDIKFSNFRLDVDAPIKLILDTISQKLGFDDKKIIKVCSEKVNMAEDGVLISLGGLDEIFGNDSLETACS